MVYRTIEVDVDVELEDFDTDDLIDELARRGKSAGEDEFDVTELLTAVWEKRRRNEDYQELLDTLIYQALGKIV
jgi:hypothetical protein